MKAPSLQAVRSMFAALIKEVIDVTPHIDLRPDLRCTKANVLVLHGLREHITSKPFFNLIERLYRADFHVVAFDFPNHGAHVNEEAKRGVVEKFWQCIETARVFLYWILLSQKWGSRPTIVIGYSFGALVLMRLLQLKFLLRKGVAGAVFISEPLKVDQNVSETMRRWIPVLKPFRELAKRIVPRYPVSPARVIDDPLHDNKPTALVTAIEIFDAASSVNAAGMIERLRELKYVAFFHGKSDLIAPIKNAFASFHRACGSEMGKFVKHRPRVGVKEFASPKRERIFVQYDRVTHDIFEECGDLVPDVIGVLDQWVKTAEAADIFVDARLLPLEDVVKFLWMLIAYVANRIWETKYQIRHLLRLLFRRGGES